MRQNVPLPPMAYPLLILGMLGAPCILVSAAMLVNYGDFDLQNPKDLAGVMIFGVLAAVVLAVTIRAFVGTLQRRESGASRSMEWMALSAPLWWGIGTVGGVWFAHNIHQDRTVSLQEYKESICGDVLEQGTEAFTACLEIALKCDDEADQGPCGRANLKSTEAAQICTDTVHKKLASLREHERALVTAPESNFTRTWRQICVLEGVREHR